MIDGQSRSDGPASRVHLIDNTDLAGTISYLSKGKQLVRIAVMSAKGQ
jgi:hypothetical protein